MQTAVLYHGGLLGGPQHGCRGLWATDDIDAARDYANTNDLGAAQIHTIVVPADARIVALRDAVPADLVEQVEKGDPAALSYSDLADQLAEQSIWAVLVETGDEHPDSGRVHRSWWIVGDVATNLHEKW
jgi:hypothetical protein